MTAVVSNDGAELYAACQAFVTRIPVVRVDVLGPQGGLAFAVAAAARSSGRCSSSRSAHAAAAAAAAAAADANTCDADVKSEPLFPKKRSKQETVS